MVMLVFILVMVVVMVMFVFVLVMIVMMVVMVTLTVGVVTFFFIYHIIHRQECLAFGSGKDLCARQFIPRCGYDCCLLVMFS